MIARHAMQMRATALAERRQVRVTVSTESVGRDGLVVVTSGIDLTAFKQNSVVLWAHDPDAPIARAVTIGANGSNLEALVQFPAPGGSPKADEIFALIGENIVNAASIGFETKASVPLDAKKPWGGERITECELQEFSFVSIPALPDALVLERARAHGRDAVPPSRHQRLAAQYARELRGTGAPVGRVLVHHRMAELYARQLAGLRGAAGGRATDGGDWRCGAARDLPLDPARYWDASAARGRLLRWAGVGGTDPDLSRAKQGFLAYDAKKPHLPEAYALPFADVIDGKLTAIGNGLDAAATRLSETELPPAERALARLVLEGYARRRNAPLRGPKRAGAALYADGRPGYTGDRYSWLDGMNARLDRPR